MRRAIDSLFFISTLSLLAGTKNKHQNSKVSFFSLRKIEIYKVNKNLDITQAEQYARRRKV